MNHFKTLIVYMLPIRTKCRKDIPRKDILRKNVLLSRLWNPTPLFSLSSLSYFPTKVVKGARLVANGERLGELCPHSA